MKSLPPYLDSTLAPPASAVRVFSDFTHDDVSAIVHEKGRPEVCYADAHFALDEFGMVAQVATRRGVETERFRPGAPGDLARELIRRIHKLGRAYGASPEDVLFFSVDDDVERAAEGLALPSGWFRSGVLEKAQAGFDTTIRAGNSFQAVQLSEEGAKQLKDGHFRKAMRSFRLARQMAPDLYSPCLALGELAIREQKWDEAEANLKQAKALLHKPRLPKKVRELEEARLEAAWAALKTRPATPPSPTPAKLPPEKPPALPSVEVVWSREELPVRLLENYQSRVFEGLPLYQLRLEAEHLRLLGGFGELLAPGRSHLTPFEHQLRTAQIALRRMRGRALLADEVGLGKTIEAGLILKEYLLRGMVSKVLILVVPSLVSQWQEEMAEKFDIPCVTTEPLDRAGSPSDFWTASPIVIASLSLAKREPYQSLILRQAYDLVIVDEAHHLRNRQTVAWKFANELKKKYLLLLTATPIQNNLEELYNLATLLRPGQLGTPDQFHREFKERGSSRRPKNTEALRSLLREIMIRHTRSSVSVKLPRRIAKTLSVEFTDAERRFYDSISNLVRRLYQENGAQDPMLLTLLQREAGSSIQAVLPTLQKLETRLPGARVAEVLNQAASMPPAAENSKVRALHRILAHTPEKCLIFTEFRQTQSMLADVLRRLGHPVDLFHGSLSSSQKGEILARFEREGRFLISTPSGGEGANLQFCRTLINYDLPWNPMKIEQRIGRIHRIGQTGEVLIYNLAAPGTVEDYLLKILDEKLNLFELVVGEAETILGDLTEEKDFETMLMDIWLESADAKELDSQMEALGERVVREKKKYLETKNLDETLFGADYETV